VQADFLLPTNNFVSLQFTVPANYFSGTNLNVYGSYSLAESSSGYSAPVSMSVSTKCGDFSSPTDVGGSSVVCRINLAGSDNGLTWYGNNPACQLQNGQTYFFNFINADISNVTANGGGTAKTSKTAKCGSTCEDNIANAPKSWH